MNLEPITLGVNPLDKIFKVSVFCLVFFLCGGTSLAESTQESGWWENNLDIGGFARGEVHVPARAPDESRTWLGLTTDIKGNGYFSDYVSGVVELRGRMYELTRDTSAHIDIREGYLKSSRGLLDFSIGQQIIAWGQAEGVNPTDNLCAMDRTIFSSEQDDQRRGSPAVKANLYAGPFTLTGVAQLFRQSKVLGPFLPETLDIETANTGLIEFPANQIIILDEDLPARNFRDAAWAVKCSFNVRMLDLSVSYFDGYSTYPDYTYNNMLEDRTHPPVKGWVWDRLYEIDQKYDHIHAIGGDFALALDPFIIRGEAAYVDTSFNDRKPDEEIPESGVPVTGELYSYPDVKDDREWRQPYFHYVVGAEWQATEDIAFSAQYSQRYVPDFKSVEELFGGEGVVLSGSDPEAAKREVTGFNRQTHKLAKKHNELVTFRIGLDFLHETLLVELKGSYWLSYDEYKLKPRIVYDVNDHLEITAAASMTFGPDGSQLDMRGRTYNQMFVELKYSF